MVLLCPECENPVTLDVDGTEEGDVFPCEDCGIELEVVSLSPVRIEAVDDSGYDDPEHSPVFTGDEEDGD